MSKNRADRMNPMSQSIKSDTSRKAIAFTLLFIGAAMPFFSALARPASGTIADVILIGSFAVLAAALVVTFTGPAE